jgi:hypothetical protein
VKILVTIQLMSDLQWKATIDGKDHSYAAMGIDSTIPTALEDLAKDIRKKAELTASRLFT